MVWRLVVGAVAVLAVSNGVGAAGSEAVGDSTGCCVAVEVRGLTPDLQWPSQRCAVYLDHAGKRVGHGEPDTLGKVVFSGLAAGHYRLTAIGERRTPMGRNAAQHRFPYKTRRWTARSDTCEVDLARPKGRDCVPARLDLIWTKREVQTWTGKVEL